MLASEFANIRLIHVGCVTLSGSLFFIRGLLRIRDVPAANHPALRFLSYVIDTGLLIAGILLAIILRQFPLTHPWLTSKVLLLVLYIASGSIALKRARTCRGRSFAMVAALVTFGFIIGVAITHHPAGWLSLLPRR
jgi:uncharacterized membrane protein SirB2